MQIIKIVAIVAVLIVCAVLALIVLAALSFSIAADIMERQDGWTDNGEERQGKRMIERLKYWIFQRGKDCKHCCLWCKYYSICRWDIADRKRKERREHEKL